jgi:hypothetical protein
VKEFLQEIGLDRYELWDEGLGWLGFRFIRPGAGDGYPFSRKAWGVAKEVISCWIPIIGYDRRHTLTLVPGSHRKNYERYLPEGQKFAQGEYRLARIPPAFDRYNPGLKRGEVVFYHPKTLHSEDVLAGRITRLNLEFRINPLSRQGGDSNQ